MKKIIALLLTVVMVLAFAACGSKTTDVTDVEVSNTEVTNAEVIDADVIGSWEQEHNVGESFMVITFAADGTGDITTMPDDIGVPLNYEVNGNTITAHLGSVDDNTTMEYNAETNQIIYDGNIYNQVESDADCDIIGSWEQPHTEGESFKIITFAADGTGDITTMPEDIGVPLNYEVKGNTITAHLGSVDDNTAMEYISSDDQIMYDSVLYSRISN